MPSISLAEAEADEVAVVLEDEVGDPGEAEVPLDADVVLAINPSSQPQTETGPSSSAGCARRQGNLRLQLPPMTLSTATLSPSPS